MNSEFTDYLEDIVDAMENAESFTAGMDYEEFAKDLRTNFAAMRALGIVGEATKRLPSSFREKYPNVPWKDMAGMRDKLVHGYDVVNLRIVWETIKNRIPQIKPQLEAILQQYNQD